MNDLDKQWKNLCNAEQREWEQKTLEQYRNHVNSMLSSSTEKTKKDHSIIKGAVVGGIVAGPAGAVVGALVQKDKNDKNRSK